MKYIGRLHRSYMSYRTDKLGVEDLKGHQQTYIFHICKNPGLSQDKLVELINVNKSNVTRQLMHLEKDGYITRVPSDDDRRVLCVFPTKKALDLYPCILEIMKEWNVELFLELDNDEKEELLRLLKIVSAKSTVLLQGRRDDE